MLKWNIILLLETVLDVEKVDKYFAKKNLIFFVKELKSFWATLSACK